MDASSLTQSHGINSMWFKSIAKTNAWSMELVGSRCSDRELATLQSAMYAPDGHVMLALPHQDPQSAMWNSVMPESVGELMYKAPCTNLYQFTKGTNATLIEEDDPTADAIEYRKWQRAWKATQAIGTPSSSPSPGPAVGPATTDRPGDTTPGE